MQKDYLLKDRPMRALFLFALPMIIGNFFQQFYTMTDSIVVGRYVSENALAAVGASHSLTTVFICVAIGGGVGASVITSRYFGAKEYDKMKLSISTALISFLAISLLLAAIGLLWGREFMIYLKTPEDILDMSVEYLNIYFYGLPFLFMYNVLSSMFNALGRSRIPLYLLIFSSIFNIVLDIYMVRSLGLGIAGVAWATLLAQGISALASFALFLWELRSYPGMTGEKATSISGKSGLWQFLCRWYSIHELASMCKVALPSIFQQSTVSIGMMLVQSVVNSFGAQMLAGYSAASRVNTFCIVPMSALGNAMSSYTAQNLGADLKERVREGYHAAIKLVLLCSVGLCAFLLLFHEGLIQAFLGDNGTALALKTGSSFLQFISFFYLFIGLKMSTDGLLRGAADMKMFTVANFANLSFRVLIAVTLAPRYGIAFVWYAVPVGWLVNFLISYAEYRTGKWRNRRTV